MDKRPWENDRRHRHPDDARSKLERWILEMGGSGTVARLVGVHQVTVGTWLARRCSPNLEVAAKILELSKGTLTIADILEGTRAW